MSPPTRPRSTPPGWILLRAGDNVVLGGLRLSPDFTGPVAFTRDAVQGDTISSSSPAWAAAAFAVGQWITISGAGANDGTYQIAQLVDENTIRVYQAGTLHYLTGVLANGTFQDVTVSAKTYPDAFLHPGAGSLTDAQRIGQNTKVVAGAWIDIHGDYDINSQPLPSLSPDSPGLGTAMHLHGTITPGPLSQDCSTTYEPDRTCNVTRIFGNVDSDTIVFDQTYLGGKTRVFGSVAPTCAPTTTYTDCVNQWAPASKDGEDFITVNQLQTMFPASLNAHPTTDSGDMLLGYTPAGDVLGGHTLTLDGQSNTDTYAINTTGSQPCFQGTGDVNTACHNYTINVLDTGAPNDGADVLIVNGVDGPNAGDGSSCSGYKDVGHTMPCPTDDIFLLRGMNFVGSTPTSTSSSEVADHPAFVALLHGNFGTQTVPPAADGIDLSLCYNSSGSCEPGQRLTYVGTDAQPFTFANGFVAGLRIHLGGGDSGVWAGDYTIDSVGVDTLGRSYIVLAETLPTGISLTTEQVPTADVQLHGVSIGLLLGDVTTPDANGDPAFRNQNYERINYDAAINGRLIVNGLGGNDAFFSDDNAAITTLDGGAGNDSFQIGQIYGLSRDSFDAPAAPGATFTGSLTFAADAVLGDTISAVSTDWATAGYAAGELIVVTGAGANDGTYQIAEIESTTTLRLVEKGALTGATSDATVNTACTPRLSGPNPADPLMRDTSCGSLNPEDVFGTVATTRGWLSAGVSQPLVAVGDVGDDTFTVYSNQAPLRLEGGDNNDLFVVRGFALAQTKLNGGDPTAPDCDPDPANPDCDIVWINAHDEIAMPRLTSGFSTAAESDIRTGAGQNQVEYNMNAPVSVDGGAGFDKLVILGTEYADHIVVTFNHIYGVGVSVSYVNIEVLEIDALEGDDTIDVLSTAPGVATRVIGGLGNDTIDVAGDVTGDVFSLDIDGTSGTLNHAVSSVDPNYNGLVAPGISYSVARAGQGSVVITETDGGTQVYEGGCYALGLTNPCGTGGTPVPALDSYTVHLASAPDCGLGPNVIDPNCWVYVTVSAAYPFDSEHSQNGGPYPDGSPDQRGCSSDNSGSHCNGDSFLVATDSTIPSSASYCGNADGSDCSFYRQITLNGQTMYVSQRSIVLAFNGSTFATDQNVFVWAVDDGRAEGTRIVTASHSVIQPVCNPDDLKRCFDAAVVRNVEVTVYDNDTADVLVTQLDPNTGHVDNNSTVLEGWGVTTALHPTTEQFDKYAISLASPPAGVSPNDRVYVDLNLSDLAPDPARVCLTSDDPRFDGSAYSPLVPGDPTTCSSNFDPSMPYTVWFDSTNWFDPVIITVHARNDFAPEDPHNTTITHTIDTTLTSDTTKYGAQAAVEAIKTRLDVLVLDDENPGVWVLESDGKTVVTACGSTCAVPGAGDSYQLRLTSQPTSQVRIALITDGQVDIQNDGDSVDSRLALESVGGLQASQTFKGPISMSRGRVRQERDHAGQRLRPRQLHRRGLPEEHADPRPGHGYVR